MSTIQKLFAEIRQLTPEERAELDALIDGSQDDEWDRQMKLDARQGKFDGLAAEALSEAKSGKAKKWP